MKVITNKSGDVFNHALFMGFNHGDKILVDDKIAEKLIEDHPSKFDIEDENGFGYPPYEIVTTHMQGNTKSREEDHYTEDEYVPVAKVGRPRK